MCLGRHVNCESRTLARRTLTRREDARRTLACKTIAHPHPHPHPHPLLRADIRGELMSREQVSDRQVSCEHLAVNRKLWMLSTEEQKELISI